jgi:hypothetical protein
MIDEEHLLEHLQSLFGKNPEQFNIIEEQIDIQLQMSYFKRSKRLKKKKVELQDMLQKVPLLYQDDVRIEEKRDILIHLASFEQVEAFRAIEAFWKVAEGDIKPWASMAYRENKMMLESSLLDEKQILISTGLGGKGQKLRYFLVFVHAQNEDFTETQQKIVRNELEFVLHKQNSEVESVEFCNQLVKIFVLIPISIAIKDLIVHVVAECNQYGNFVSENFLITNVKELENEEIFQIIQEKSIESEYDDFDEIEGFEDDEDEDDE